MEKYDLYGELRLLATANNWKFVMGTSDYANAANDANDEMADGQLLLWVDLQSGTTRGAGGVVNNIAYTGNIALLGKFDTLGTESSMDEDIEQKHDRRIKDIAQVLSDNIQLLVCSNNLVVLSENYEPVYNVFDTNLDGILGTYTIGQTDFEAVQDTFNLTLSTDGNGTTEPFDSDTQSYPKYTIVPINAVPNAGFNFSNWSGIQNTSSLTYVTMTNNINAIAQFIDEYLQYIFSTTPIKLDDNYFFRDQTSDAVNINLICDGNSITLGTGSCIGDVTKAYPQLLNETIVSTSLNKSVYVNKGIGGYTGAQMNANYTTRIRPLLSNTRTNILLAFEFANDMNGGATAQQAYDNIKAYCLQAKADGWIVVVLSAPWASTVTDIDDANALLRSDNSFTDYFIDQYQLLDETFMTTGAYSCDGVHLKDAGIALQSEYIYNEMISQSIISVANKVSDDVQINNTPYVELVSGEHANTLITPGSKFTVIFDGVLKMPTSGGPFDIISTRTNPFITGDFALYILNGQFQYFTVPSGGVDLKNTGLFYTQNNRYKILFSIDTTTNDVYFRFITDTGEFTYTNTYPGLLSFVNNIHVFGRNFFGYGSCYDYKLYNDYYTTFDSVQEISLQQHISFNENSTLDLIDLSGNGNDGILQGIADYSTVRLLSDLQNPIYLSYGYTLFVNDSDSLDYFIAPYDKDGIPTVTTKTGYTKATEGGIGVISNTPNTYLGIKHSDWELNEKTFNDIHSEPESDSYVITKDTNTVSNLKLK